MELELLESFNIIYTFKAFLILHLRCKLYRNVKVIVVLNTLSSETWNTYEGSKHLQLYPEGTKLVYRTRYSKILRCLTPI